VENGLPVCPVYVILQSGQVNLYTPDLLYLSRLGVVGVNNSPCSVFLLVYVILTGVWRKSLVMYLVSLLKQVKRDNFVWGVVGGLLS
jgi:hypothetical protein